MSAQCKKCGSWAINNHLHGRDGSDPDLCDVCYWRVRAVAAGGHAQYPERAQMAEGKQAPKRGEKKP